MDRLDTFRQELRDFVAERDWRRFHDPKNLSMLLASEAHVRQLRGRRAGCAKLAHSFPCIFCGDSGRPI